MWSNYLKTVRSIYILGSKKKISLALSHFFRQWKQNNPCHASHTFLFIAKRKEKKKKTFQFCTSLDYKNHVRTTSSYQIPTSFDHRWIIAGLFYVHCVYVRALMNWRNQDFLGLTLNMGHNQLVASLTVQRILSRLISNTIECMLHLNFLWGDLISRHLLRFDLCVDHIHI